MRVAALYDVHGNLPALDAVLTELDADVILVGGDFVAGPWPAETLERLRGLDGDVRYIRGNADRELTEPPKPQVEARPPQEVLEWVRERLSDEQLAFLTKLPLTDSVEVDGLGRVLFCHATPRDDNEILTRISPDQRWRRALAGVEADVIVCVGTDVAELPQLPDGAALGGTRAACEAGLLPRSRQIGLLGRQVAPHLLVAVGVRGDSEELTGFVKANVVAAIGSDGSAPMLAAADVAVVGDRHDVLPALLEAI